MWINNASINAHGLNCRQAWKAQVLFPDDKQSGNYQASSQIVDVVSEINAGMIRVRAIISNI